MTLTTPDHHNRLLLVATSVIVSVAFLIMGVYAMRAAQLRASGAIIAAPSVSKDEKAARLSHELKQLDVARLKASIGEEQSVFSAF